MNKITLLCAGLIFGIGGFVKAMENQQTHEALKQELRQMVSDYHNKNGVTLQSLFLEALNEDGKLFYFHSLYSILTSNKAPDTENQISWAALEKLYIKLFDLFKEDKKVNEHKTPQRPKQYRLVPSKFEIGLYSVSLLALGCVSGWLAHSFLTI